MKKKDPLQHLPYSLDDLPRESKRHYISASHEDIQAMLATCGLKKTEDLFAHIRSAYRWKAPLDIPKDMPYRDLVGHIHDLASRNVLRSSFLGDGLARYAVMPIAKEVSGIRSLTTSYTAYQGERSQGSLISLWIYQCLLSGLSGFEAVNASMYDRATALCEAIQTLYRLERASGRCRVLLLSTCLYPGDLDCLRTFFTGLPIELDEMPLRPEDEGAYSPRAIQKRLQAGSYFGAVIASVNTLGHLEDVDRITDVMHAAGVKVIATVDPMLLGKGGLKAPAQFGMKGADIFVGEGQTIALGPHYGGPGLGIMGIRFNQENKGDVRAMPGKFVGRALDQEGRMAFALVLSTREQHIRREKATSNICSNQAFVATLAGASLLARGEQGMEDLAHLCRQRAREAYMRLSQYEGVTPLYPNRPFYNEFVLKLDKRSAPAMMQEARRTHNLHLGAHVSGRTGLPDRDLSYIKLSFTDAQSEADMQTLYAFFEAHFKRSKPPCTPCEVPLSLQNEGPSYKRFPLLKAKEISDYYHALGRQNASPDEGCYPLGSCTMKYNPYLNDYAASLKSFEDMHPQAPLDDCQGTLEIIHANQEYFKNITGLAGVTTQPVAGAQGELVGLKMFLAYFHDKGETYRDVLLIPISAHGTNPASAVCVGFNARPADDSKGGLCFIPAGPTGEMDVAFLEKAIKRFDKRIAGIMITNPNTSGIFETQFKSIADRIHHVGGLVYMDGANMNAIAGWINLAHLGVDAVHNNVHKTWSIPHGGGGPGDAFVAVSKTLVDYLPGYQVIHQEGRYTLHRPKRSIGSVHRHFGNVAHKIRAYTYVRALGREGVKRMSAIAVLSSRYVESHLKDDYPRLPKKADATLRLHEFILTLDKALFDKLTQAGLPKGQVMGRMGKLFLDFGFHAPTISFPEPYGMMIEPTESYTKAELDRFITALKAMKSLIEEHPSVLHTVPHFTPVSRIDEVQANKDLCLSEPLRALPTILHDRLPMSALRRMSMPQIKEAILKAHFRHQASSTSHYIHAGHAQTP